MGTGPYREGDPLFAPRQDINWTPEQLAEQRAQTDAANERRTVSLSQSQSTPASQVVRGDAIDVTGQNAAPFSVGHTNLLGDQRPQGGAVPYTAPAPTGGTLSYDIREIQLNAKADAYTAAIAQGKTPEEAENIGSTAGLNAGDAALRGVFADINGSTTASSPGVGAANDDNSNGINTISGTNAGLNSSTQPSGGITPQPNVLDNFASYTYNISWYLLTLPQATQVMTSAKMDTSQWSLLVQSGGAPAAQQGSSQTGTAGLGIPSFANLTPATLTKGGTTTRSTGGRNQFFPLDYYIDNLEIESTISGSSPGTISSIRFQVTEPNGLTLLPNLNSAVRQAYKNTTATPRQAHYCLVIKFYGWDINGNLITDPSNSRGIFGAVPSSSNAAVVRYYPFKITNFNFKLAGKQVEYAIEGTAAPFVYATSTAFGSVPYNIELTGETVTQVLVGNGKTDIVPLDSTGKPKGSGREATLTDTPGTTNTTKDAKTSTVSTDNSAQAEVDRLAARYPVKT